jgi:hypothetical protein
MPGDFSRRIAAWPSPGTPKGTRIERGLANIVALDATIPGSSN